MNLHKVFEAIKLATVYHDGQKRKKSNLPYIVHPLRVMESLYDYSQRFVDASGEVDTYYPIENLLCIAVLHDLLEDTKCEPHRIGNNFGFRVLDGIEWLTNQSKGSKLPRTDRKKMDREHIAKAPVAIKLVKLLDRLDNVMDFVNNKNSDQDFNKLYAQETRLLLDAIGPCWEDVKQEVLKAVEKLEQKEKHNGTSQ